MGADRPSLRAVLAALLVLSAALFAVGIVIERGATADTHGGLAASPSTEGSHSESGESGSSGESAGHPASSAIPEAGSALGESGNDANVMGLDLESPLFVGAAFLISLGLAFAVLRTRSPLVLWAVVAFAVAFGLLDLREASHQLDEGRPVIATVAIALLIIHPAIAVIAAWLAIAANRRTLPA